MYISKIEFDAVEAAHRLYAGRAAGSEYVVHQELWTLFSDSPGRKRDFVYRQTGPTSFLVVSARMPDGDSPLVRKLMVKPYQPHLSVGECVAFSLRLNPVMTIHNRTTGRHQRVDMVQNERKRLLREGIKAEDLPRRTSIAQQILPGWFARHDLGFAVERDALMVESYGQQHFLHPRGNKPVTLACLDVQGRAVVQSPETLLQALFHGVGYARGFGFGLLLVRRA